MRKYFFENINEAVLYLMFLSLLPIVSIFAQYTVNDRTMYVSFLVAGFSMTYDYFILFKKNICKRLWWEALIATVCLLLTTCLGVINLIFILTNENIDTYKCKDLFFISVLAIVVLINMFEFVLLFKKEYNQKYGEQQKSNLISGAQKV